MNNLSNLSDDELMQLKAKKQMESNRASSLSEMSDDELLSLKRSKETETKNRPVEAFATGLGNATAFGYGAELGASKPVSDASDWIVEKISGLKVPESTYEQRLKENISQRDSLRASNPYASIGGEVAGTVGSAWGLGRALQGLGALKNVGVVSKGIGPATRWATLGQKVGNAAKEGIAYGALANPNPENTEMSGNQELAQRIENAGTAGGLSAIFPIAGQGLRSAGAGIKEAPKKLLTLLGVSEDTINEYLSRSKQINGAPSITDFKSKVDGIVDTIIDDVKSKGKSVEEAKEAFKEFKSTIKDQSGLKLADAKTALRDAEQRLNQTFEATKQGLKNTQAPTHLAPDITQGIKKLQERVTNGSREAFEILEKEGKPVELTGIPQSIVKIAEGFKVGGGKFATSKAEASYKFLMNQAQRLFELPARMSGRDAKRVLQQLDDEIQWASRTGQYTGDEARALQSVRVAIDEVLKRQSPSYAKKMQQVAKDVQLLNRASESFGDAYGLPGKLQGIGGSGSRDTERKILQELGDTMGFNYNKPIDEFMTAQSRAKDPSYLQGLKNSLPESQAMNKAKVVVDDAATAASPRTLNKQGFESTQFKTLEEAKAAYEAAKVTQKKNLPGVSRQTTQRLILDVMNNRSIEAVKKLEFISKLADEDLVQIAKDIGTRSQFNKTAFNGSRNVNLFGIVMQAAAKPAIGAVVGGVYEGGLEGAAMGAVTGAMVDRYGPRATKKILDIVIRARGNPTVDMFRKVELPPMVKREVISLIDSARRGTTGRSGVSPVESLSKVSEQDNAMKRRLKKAD
jgi:hypothetical protein